MSKCEHCPIKEGVCKAEVDSRYSFFCGQAASGGNPSQILAIKITSGVPARPPRPPAPIPKITAAAAHAGVGCGSCGERRARLAAERARLEAERQRRAEVKERLG